MFVQGEEGVNGGDRGGGEEPGPSLALGQP